MLLSDLRQAMAPDAVLADLSRNGLALISGVHGPAQLVELLGEIGGTVIRHRDSGPDGVTVIEDREARAAAFAGFTRGPLLPHTDRSGTADPPDLVLTACGAEPTSGGEAVLVDGRSVHLELAETAPASLAALSAPRSVLFGGAGGHLSSVFEEDERGIVRVRLRLDALARFGPAAATHVARLRAAIERHARSMPVRSGSGYVLDNRRWLHGRGGYEGARIMYRLTARARPGSVTGGFLGPSVTPDR